MLISWCTAAVVGRRKNEWQSLDYVLGWFGENRKLAIKNYRQFVQSGIGQGRQPHLVGRGLIRSIDSWSEVKVLRRINMRELSDDRILGSGDFVRQITEEVYLVQKYRFTASERLEKAIEAIKATCTKQQIKIEALRNSSRVGLVSRTRSILAIQLVHGYGLSLAETARQLGVSTSAITKVIKRKQNC